MKDASQLLYIAVAFLIGLGLGLYMTRSVTSTPVTLAVVDVDDVIAKGLENKVGAFAFTVIQKTNTASVEIFQLIDDVPMHYHPQENHVLYITKGRAIGKVGDVTANLAPGMLVFIPKGEPHSVDVVEAPFEFVLFSTPPFNPDDVVWVEQPAAKEEETPPTPPAEEPAKPKELTVQLLELDGSGQSGTATLTDIDGDTTVVLTLDGVPEGAEQPAHIHFGSCSNLGSVKYPLSPVTNGKSQTELTDSMDEILANLPLTINVHKSEDKVNVYVTCGDVETP